MHSLQAFEPQNVAGMRLVVQLHRYLLRQLRAVKHVEHIADDLPLEPLNVNLQKRDLGDRQVPEELCEGLGLESGVEVQRLAHAPVVKVHVGVGEDGFLLESAVKRVDDTLGPLDDVLFEVELVVAA